MYLINNSYSAKWNYGHTYHNLQLAEQMDYIYYHIFQILNGFIVAMFLLFWYLLLPFTIFRNSTLPVKVSEEK